MNGKRARALRREAAKGKATDSLGRKVYRQLKKAYTRHASS